MAEGRKHVCLLGDSTLDNIIWLKSYEECIKYKLLQSIGAEVEISNYAADGFTTTNMLQGGVPALSYTQRLQVDPYPCALTNFRPLEYLKQLHSHQPVTEIVLSVGGNDIRVVLRSIDKLMASMHQFTENYQQILEACLEITPRVIIMMQYRPSITQDNVYGIYHSISMGTGDAIGKMNLLMQQMYPQLLKVAEAFALPLIDLPNTFDPRFSDLFCSQIEPSAQGSSLIAKMISHVFKTHEWTQSKLYSCSPKNYNKIPGTSDVELGTISVEVNDGNGWIVKELPEFSGDILKNWATNGENEESDEDCEYDADSDRLFSKQMKLLEEMGYSKDACLPLLQQTNGDVVEVIDLLNDN